MIYEDFKPGKKYFFHVETDKLDFRDKTRASNSTNFVLEVFDKTPFYRTCRLSYDKTILSDGVSMLRNDTINGAQDWKRNLIVDLQIDANGKLQGFLNFDSCKMQVRQNLRATYKNIPGMTPTDVQIDEVFQFMEPTFESQDVFLETYFPEIPAFFTLFGDTLSPDSVYASDDSVSLAFDIPAVKLHCTKRIQAIKGDLMTITTNQNTSESLKDFVNAYINNYVPDDCKNKIKDDDATSSGLIVVGTYKYDVDLHQLKEVIRLKTIKVDSIIKKVQIEITRIP